MRMCTCACMCMCMRMCMCMCMCTACARHAHGMRTACARRVAQHVARMCTACAQHSHCMRTAYARQALRGRGLTAREQARCDAGTLGAGSGGRSAGRLAQGTSRVRCMLCACMCMCMCMYVHVACMCSMYVHALRCEPPEGQGRSEGAVARCTARRVSHLLAGVGAPRRGYRAARGECARRACRAALRRGAP